MAKHAPPKVFQVDATRSDGWWAITSPDLPGLFSQAKRYREVEPMALDAIAMLTDRDPRTVSMVVTPRLGGDLDAKIRRRRELVQQVDEVQREAARASAEVLGEMAALGLSQRDAADVLGVTFQRVGQLWPVGR